jgi:hypothetical protein
MKMNLENIITVVAIARQLIGPDVTGFLTLALLVVWFLRDQFGSLFNR